MIYDTGDQLKAWQDLVKDNERLAEENLKLKERNENALRQLKNCSGDECCPTIDMAIMSLEALK